MNRRTIILLIVITIILIIISVTTVVKNPCIKGAYISCDKELTIDELESCSNEVNFSCHDSKVYAILFVEDLSSEDKITVNWNTVQDNIEKTIQESIIYPEKDGTGKVIISLARRNKTLPPGNYTVEIFLNDIKVVTRQFNIENSSATN